MVVGTEPLGLTCFEQVFAMNPEIPISGWGNAIDDQSQQSSNLNLELRRSDVGGGRVADVRSKMAMAKQGFRSM